jgi:hypothetical protein
VPRTLVRADWDSTGVCLVLLYVQIGTVLACASYSCACRLGQYWRVPRTLVRADSWLHPRLLAQELSGKEMQGCCNLSVWTFHVHVSTYNSFVAMHEWYRWTNDCRSMNLKKSNSCVSKTVNAEWYKTDLTFTTDKWMGTEFFEFWLVNTCPLCCGSNLVLWGERHNNVLH